MRSKADILLLEKFMYPTSDDWRPNFPRNCVECKMYEYLNVKGETCMFRLHIRGADDTMMEKDIRVDNSADSAGIERTRAFLRTYFCNMPNPLTMEYLSEQGFEWS